MVAGYAAKQLAELGLKSGDLTIVSAERAAPYERPPLSKGFLAGRDSEESIRIVPDDFYGAHGIDLRLETEVTGISAAQKRIQLSTGEEVVFEKLILATGSRVRTLDVPGASLAEIFYLRSIDDARRIRARAETAKRVAVVGGGFIGMEVASVLAQKGIQVTMIMREARVVPQLFSPEMSAFFEAYYKARGVEFAKQATLREIRGMKTVGSVVLADGQKITCDTIVAGIGVRPAIDFLASTGIETSNGVMVNQYLETNQPGIYAAGDIANYQDVLFGKRRRVEHWDNAVSQGLHCARTLMSERAEFCHVPYFFSDVFDLSYEFWGDPADAEEIVHRGDMASNSFSTWWVRGQRLVAAFAMNRPEEERNTAPKWIEAGQRVFAAGLRDASQPIGAAGRFTQTNVP